MKPISKSKEVFLNPVEAEQVFKTVRVENQPPQLFLGDYPIEDNVLWNLATECEQLKGMRIWSIFQETLKQQAQDLVFCNPGTPNEPEKAHGGKWMLYNLQEQKAIVELIINAAKHRLPRKRPAGV